MRHKHTSRVKGPPQVWFTCLLVGMVICSAVVCSIGLMFSQTPKQAMGSMLFGFIGCFLTTRIGARIEKRKRMLRM